jgi:hypothetical protein
MGKNSKANKDKSLYARYKEINNPKDPNTLEKLLRLPEGKTFKEFISTSTYNPYRYNEDQISNNE